MAEPETERRARSRAIEVAVWAAALVALLLFYLWAHRDAGRLEETKEQGTAIVRALESYRRAHGGYPDSLPQLVPAHLEAVEPPALGYGPWRYRPVARADTLVFFDLSTPAAEDGYPTLRYDPVARRWEEN